MSEEIPEPGEVWVANANGDARSAIIMRVFDGENAVTAQVWYPDGETVEVETYPLEDFTRDWEYRYPASPAANVGRAVGAGVVQPEQSWRSRWADYGVLVTAAECGGALIRFVYAAPSEYQSKGSCSLSVTSFLAAYRLA